MSCQRFKITTATGTPKFDPETCQMFNTFGIKVGLYKDSQHDGRPWGDELVLERHKEIMEEIMTALRLELAKFIVQSNPLGVHR